MSTEEEVIRKVVEELKRVPCGGEKVGAGDGSKQGREG